MPIFSSFGSLTYDKTSGGQFNGDYWLIQASNANADGFFSDFYLDTSNNITFVASTNYDLKMNVAKISGNINPIIAVNRSWNLSGANTDQNAWSTNIAPYNGNLLNVGYGYGNYTPTFPYNKVGIGGIYQANTSTLAVTYEDGFWSYSAPATANSKRTQIQACLTDNTSNYYIGISYYAPNASIFGIIKLDGLNLPADILGDGSLTIGGSPNYNYYASSYISSLQFTTDSNLIALSTIATSNTSGTSNPRANVYLTKKNSTPSNSNVATNALETIWYSNIAPSTVVTNNFLRSTGLSLDSNDNSYVTLYNNTLGIGYIVKQDNTGTEIWQKEVSGLSILDSYVKSDNEIYTIGVERTVSNAAISGGNLWIAKIDSNANILWQNEMSGNYVFAYANNTNQEVLNAKISGDGSNLYIGIHGGVANSWSLLKIPDDGNIPGNGNYYVTNNTYLKYINSNYSFSSGNLYISVVSNGSPAGNIESSLTYTGLGDQSNRAESTSRLITFIS